jgi:hypothetical protein
MWSICLNVDNVVNEDNVVNFTWSSPKHIDLICHIDHINYSLQYSISGSKPL